MRNGGHHVDRRKKSSVGKKTSRQRRWGSGGRGERSHHDYIEFHFSRIHFFLHRLGDSRNGDFLFFLFVVFSPSRSYYATESGGAAPEMSVRWKWWRCVCALSSVYLKMLLIFAAGSGWAQLLATVYVCICRRRRCRLLSGRRRRPSDGYTGGSYCRFKTGIFTRNNSVAYIQKGE